MRSIKLRVSLGLCVATTIGCSHGQVAQTLQSCLPGESRACFGPGQCSGAQVCAADGLSLGPCECAVASGGATSAGGKGGAYSTGGASATIGSLPTGGTIAGTVASAPSGTGTTGGTNATQTTNATGGTSAATGSSSIGGAASIGGTGAQGGSSSAGGTSSRSTGDSTLPCLSNTNILSYRGETGNNWIGGDEASTTDNPCGIQGNITAFSDNVPSATFPSPISASPCTADGACCVSGATQLWTSTASMTGYQEWGAGLLIEFNQAAGISSPYLGPAKGFAITLSGRFSGQMMRLSYLDVNAVKSNETSPYILLPGAPGTTSLLFESLSCPTWSASCTQGAIPFGLTIQIVGGDAAGAFNFCLDSLTPLL